MNALRHSLPLALAATVALGAGPLGAQTTPRDTVRIGGAPADTLAPADTVSLGLEVEERAPEPSRWGTPFAVESSGTVAARPPRGEVVWVASAARSEARPAAPAVAPVDSVRPAPRPAAPPRSAAAPTPRPAARPRTHTVAPGETFYGIARRYAVTSAALRAANPDARWENLRTGETLRIPATGGTSAAPARTGGARPAATPARGRRTHTVARGETLFGLARRYGVSAESIRRANDMETDQVRIGQTLVIPPAS